MKILQTLIAILLHLHTAEVVTIPFGGELEALAGEVKPARPSAGG
jgi:hypothetical protein